MGGDLPDKPNWAFTGERSLSDACVQDALANSGDMHDAYLSCVRSGPSEMVLTFDEPYFPSIGQYRQFRISKAVIRLCIQQNMSSDEMTLLDGVVDLNVYQIDFQAEENRFHLSLEPFYDLEFDFIAEKSTFRWVFYNPNS